MSLSAVAYAESTGSGGVSGVVRTVYQHLPIEAYDVEIARVEDHKKVSIDEACVARNRRSGYDNLEFGCQKVYVQTGQVLVVLSYKKPHAEFGEVFESSFLVKKRDLGLEPLLSIGSLGRDRGFISRHFGVSLSVGSKTTWENAQDWRRPCGLGDLPQCPANQPRRAIALKTRLVSVEVLKLLP